jgi:hypothetical protein
VRGIAFEEGAAAKAKSDTLAIKESSGLKFGFIGDRSCKLTR